MAFSPVLIRDAIVFANIITLMCVGITTTYMTTKVPNFAQGAFVGVGIYVTITATRLWNMNPYLGLPLAFLLGGLTAFLMYRLAIRPQMRRRASVVLLMISTLAVDVLFIGILNVYADYLQTGLKVIARSVVLRKEDFTFAGFPGVFVVSSVILASSIVLLYIFLNKTKFGIALRATVEDADLAGTMGINVQSVYSVAWFISGGLAGVAGGLMPLWFLSSTNTGDLYIVEMFAGALLGGVYSMFGTFLGGFILALVEVLVSTLLGQVVSPQALTFRPVIPLLVMVAILLIAPSGIGGIKLRKWRQRV